MLRYGFVVGILFLSLGLLVGQEKIDGKLIVGKWEPTTAPAGAKIVMEFTKDEKLKIDAEFNGQKMKMEGTYKLTGDTLDLNLKVEGKEMKEKIKVLKLTDTEMVTREGDKKEETLKRVKE